MRSRLPQFCLLLLIISGLLVAPMAHATAQITIVNSDPPGQGLNDPTPREPVGGNPGATLGEQRLNVANLAASAWSEILDSDVEMRVSLSYQPFGASRCGSFGDFDFADFAADFPGAIFPNTWYPPALANKLAGFDLFPDQNHLLLQVNADYDAGNCPGSSPMYYGFDAQASGGLDMVAVNVRQIAHGLGFYNLVDASTGRFYQGKPDIFTHFMLDTTTGLTWAEMTDEQRRVSATNFHHVVWNGSAVTWHAPCFLQMGAPSLTVHTEDGDLSFDVLRSIFGAPLQYPGITGAVVAVGLGCDPLPSIDGIALVDRGVCTFIEKLRNAQNAGATGVILANNVNGSPPSIGGYGPDIVVPNLSISLSDGNAIKDALSRGPVTAELGLDPSRRAGTDSEGRILLYTPNPAGAGPNSSGGYWDFNVLPSLLIMPTLPRDLPPLPATVDITPYAARDLGW